MGLKSGSRDAGLNEDADDDAETVSETDNDSDEGNEFESAATTVDDDNLGSSRAESGSKNDTSSDSQRPTIDSIPYKLRREKVNEGREQVPFFLREEVIDAEDELQASLEDRLGEEIYKSDYREAAMVLAQRNPDLIAEVLREWGYDLDTA